MRTLSLILSLLLAAPVLAGDADVDAMQREIIRLTDANAKLRDQLKEAKRAAPILPAEELPDEPADKPAKRPAKRAAAPRVQPTTRDCPACSRGRLYGPVTIAVPIFAPGWGWGVTYTMHRGLLGTCPACGGTGRLPNSLAGR